MVSVNINENGSFIWNLETSVIHSEVDEKEWLRASWKRVKEESCLCFILKGLLNEGIEKKLTKVFQEQRILKTVDHEGTWTSVVLFFGLSLCGDPMLQGRGI